MPPALGLFSTITVWPRGLAIDCASTRATVSVGPPAAYGTSMVMFLVGYCWAAALTAMAEITMPRPRARVAGMGNPPDRLRRLKVKPAMLLQSPRRERKLSYHSHSRNSIVAPIFFRGSERWGGLQRTAAGRVHRAAGS